MRPKSPTMTRDAPSDSRANVKTVSNFDHVTTGKTISGCHLTAGAGALYA